MGGAPALRRARMAWGTAPPPSLPYKVDTSRPSLRTNWTRTKWTGPHGVGNRRWRGFT